jgi:hypothetical protein
VILLKTCNSIVNMNAALIDTLLSLILTAFKLLYEQERIINPNAVFHQCFDWFVTKYGCTSAEDRKTNRTAMATDWHPSMGFEVLTSCFFHSVTFASLSGHPIANKDTVDISVRVLNHTGLVAEEYKTWILQVIDANNATDFAAFKSFWEKAVQIAAFTSVPANQHGYGMAATDDDTSASLTDAVSNFGTAYAATPESSDPTGPTSWRHKGNFKCSAKPSAMASPLPLQASSTTNSAHVADTAVDKATRWQQWWWWLLRWQWLQRRWW